MATDLDLDGWPDLLGLPAHGSKPGETARRSGPATKATRSPRGRCRRARRRQGATASPLADLAGDPLPDLLVAPARRGPVLAQNLGNGHHWLALQLGGHWRVKPELMRTNSHAIGTRVIVEGQGLHVTYDHTTPDSGLGQSIGPVVLGLGKRDDGRPGPPALARRRDAVRAERRRRRSS